MDDFELLKEYVDRRSHDAFAELVGRHIGLVYSSALRQVRDPHAAEDVTQAVFISLARNARKLRRGQLLAAWLMTATRYISSHARRSRSRREHHEHKAAQMAITMTQNPESNEWQRIAPELDEAIASLGTRTRDAVLLRYFEGKSVREVAAALKISEDAAKQRLSRAVEQLRSFFAGRGITVSSALLGPMLASHAVHPVPTGLTAAVAAASAKVGTSLAISKGAVALMTAIKTKAAAVAVLVLTIGTTTGVVVHQVLARERIETVAIADARPFQPQRQADQSWRKNFNRVYHLADGEIVKRVIPPYIPERDAMANDIDPARTMMDITGDCLTKFLDRNGEVEFNSWWRGKPTVLMVIQQLVGLPTFKLEIPLKDQLRQIPGDWVVRPDLGEDKLMDALATIFREQIGWKIRFEKRSAEHNVIVARGSYSKPHTKDGAIELRVDGMGARGGMGAGNVRRLVTMLGEMTEVESVDETAANVEGVFWSDHIGGKLTPENADKLLANVSKQTGLTFTREKRVTAHWVAVPVEK
jgi:RNA polymerase sigma factor (sigma-70 family)